MLIFTGIFISVSTYIIIIIKSLSFLYFFFTLMILIELDLLLLMFKELSKFISSSFSSSSPILSSSFEALIKGLLGLFRVPLLFSLLFFPIIPINVSNLLEISELVFYYILLNYVFLFLNSNIFRYFL